MPDRKAGVLRVRLLRQSLRLPDEAVELLLGALNAGRTVYPGTDLRLVYEFSTRVTRQPSANDVRVTWASPGFASRSSPGRADPGTRSQPKLCQRQRLASFPVSDDHPFSVRIPWCPVTIPQVRTKLIEVALPFSGIN